MPGTPNRHPPAEVLEAFGLGRLAGPASDTVSAHLDTCLDCRRIVADLSADSFVGRLQAAEESSAGTSTAIPPELANHPDYRIERELGRGGMGVVYLARNTLMHRDEVLKVAHQALLEKPGTGERFLQEIRSAAQLMHVNVVRAYAALRVGELLVFAMEFVPGDDLGKIVRTQGALSVVKACNFTAQVALGLQHAHEKGMVHRDIKPSNLILSTDGKKPVVKILDFGLAKMTSEVGLAKDLTGSQKMMGTPDYVAPEQILDAAKAGIQADIYSLGCTLYYLLTGSPPFRGKSLYEVLHAHSTAAARPLNLVRPEVPAELAAVVAKMMAKDPAKRYRTPGEAAAELIPFTKPETAVTAATLWVEATEKGPSPAALRAAKAQGVAAEPTARPAAAASFDFDAEEKTNEPTSTLAGVGSKKRRRDLRIAAAVAIGVGIIGLLFLLMVAFRPATPEGTVVLENVPDLAEVKFDGKLVMVKAIRTSPGRHKVEVRKPGFKDFAEEVDVGPGGEASVRIRLDPIVPPVDPLPPSPVVPAAPKEPPHPPTATPRVGEELLTALEKESDSKAVRKRLPDLAKLTEHATLDIRQRAVALLSAAVDSTDRDDIVVCAALRKALLSSDEEARQKAAVALAKIGGEPGNSAADAIIEALRNGKLAAKRSAAAAFAYLEPKAAAKGLKALVAALSYGDPTLQENAILGIRSLGQAAEPAVKDLVAMIVNRKERTENRRIATVALQSIGIVKSAVDAAPALLILLADAKEPGIIREGSFGHS